MKVQLLADLWAHLLTAVSADSGQAQGIGHTADSEKFSMGKTFPISPHASPTTHRLRCGSRQLSVSPTEILDDSPEPVAPHSRFGMM